MYDTLQARVHAFAQFFISRGQYAAIAQALRGEEASHFRAKIAEYANRIATMPRTRDTDGQGGDAIAHLHYFIGGCDWYITERDIGDADDAIPGEQLQAFGMADLGCPELGYINLSEALRHGAELDLYWTPKPLRAIYPDKFPPRDPPKQKADPRKAMKAAKESVLAQVAAAMSCANGEAWPKVTTKGRDAAIRMRDAIISQAGYITIKAPTGTMYRVVNNADRLRQFAKDVAKSFTVPRTCAA